MKKADVTPSHNANTRKHTHTRTHTQIHAHTHTHAHTHAHNAESDYWQPGLQLKVFLVCTPRAVNIKRRNWRIAHNSEAADGTNSDYFTGTFDNVSSSVS